MTTTSAAAASLTAGPSPTAGLTVPELAREIDYPLDRLRTLIGRHAKLRELLVRVGPLRVLPAQSLEAFRAALSAASSTSSRGRSPTSNVT